MPTTAHGFPYPDPDSARDVPADIMALAAMSDSYAVLRCPDEAARDSLFTDLPAGQLVATTQAPWFVWLKAGSGKSWTEVLSDTGWITEGFTVGEGWGLGRYQQIRQRNGLVEIRADVERTGDPIVAPSNGNVTDTTLIAAPSRYAPVGTYPTCQIKFSTCGGEGMLWTNGSMILTSASPGATIDTGNYGRFSITYFAG